MAAQRYKNQKANSAHLNENDGYHTLHYRDEYEIGDSAYGKQYYADQYNDKFPATAAPSRSSLNGKIMKTQYRPT